MGTRSIFVENSEAYRQRVLDLRNQGITANPHKSWVDMAKRKLAARYAHIPEGSWGACYYVARQHWQRVREEAIDDYRSLVYPPAYDWAYDDVPF